MKDLIKKVPLPLCGVMLGTAALGNLLQSYSETVRNLCGIAAAFLLVLLVLKLIFFPKSIAEDMKNPIMASVSGTFTMGLMILSTYLKPYAGGLAFGIWVAAILLHLALIVYFTLRFVLKLQMPKVFASYYIVYVGIAVAAVTAPAYNQTGFGSLTFWFGFVTFLALLALVTYRYVKYPEVPAPAKPLFCIYAAPLSLCIAGYVQSVMPKSFGFLAAMLAGATLIYVIALVKAAGYLKLPFAPSYAAFTFPFVISAIAAKQSMACFAKMNHAMPWLQWVVLIETVIAAVFVVYVYARFMMAIFRSEKKA